MNDFLRTMGQFGVESCVGAIDGAGMSLEEEMKEEVAIETDLDDSLIAMEAANIIAATSQCESILVAMAEREAGLESAQGKSMDAIYTEFGIESIKDVAARKAYSGIASLKALINTCIGWLRQLIGISYASKKVFAGLEKKAKAMYKNLTKVQAKVTEKFKRELPDYGEALTKALGTYAVTLAEKTKGYATVEDFIKSVSEKLAPNAKDAQFNALTKRKDLLEEKNKDLDELYDKGDTTEFEGSAALNKIMTVVKALETSAAANKKVDAVKTYNDEIKALEKFRKELDKGSNKSLEAVTNVAYSYVSKRITVVNLESKVGKKSLKLVVKIADDLLTMAKGTYAELI